jgi:FAD/FMN-containing dehydrogenase/Fe-S oxidoreductase
MAPEHIAGDILAAMSWTADFASELGGRIRGRVAADPMTRALYSTDASIYRSMPLAAVIPRDDDDVRATVEYAARRGLPLLPRGGGTSLEGQTVNEALIVDLSAHLDGILEVNVEEMWARVQPGVVQERLRRHVEASGLDFGPDTATAARATLGGMLGNNSAGAHSIVYGKTIDHVREVRCLLADGTETVFGELDEDAFQAKQKLDGIEGRIYRTVAAVLARNGEAIRERYPRIMRHVCGYSLDYLLRDEPLNMAHLIIGSEGTLATILEAKVGLVRRPSARALLVSQYDDLVTAMEAARLIVPSGPSAVELVDDLVIRQARNHPALGPLCGFVHGEPKGVLITEYSGDDERQVADQVDAMRRTLESEGLGYGFHAATGAREQAQVWEVRKSGLSLLLSVEGDAKPIAFVEDTAVPVDRLPEYVQRLQQVVDEHDTWAGFYGHASVGCLHFRPLINCKQSDDIAKLRSIAESIRDLVAEFGGSLSGEHGDGRTRTEYLPGFYGDDIYNGWRAIKTAFDPDGRLNPGNICDPFSAAEAAERSAERHAEAADPRPIDDYLIDTNLRYGSDYGTHVEARYLDFSRQGGMASHIEMCNGNGFCRKLDAGTMCPSYQVTRQEKDCTRGRANALRTVISGGIDERDFASHSLYEVLDLCLECKGCRSECPSNVDMAKLKYEFLAQYYDAHGTPRRSRFFADVAATSRFGSRFAPLSNWIANAAPVRWLNERALGISSRRPVPPFVRQTFESWFNARPDGNGAVTRARGPVVLFHDTFMNHNYPDVGRDAVAVLEAAGYDVILAPKVCCGRPMLSNGLAGRARENAQINVERLAGFAQRGVPIVGCEPSCLLMLREDYLDLLPRSANAAKVAQHSFLIEEFLLRAAAEERPDVPAGGAPPDAGAAPLGLPLRPVPRRLLVHGHCHQKASVGMTPTLELLRWVPGYEPQPVDAGCCGMAGSFGYKAEHYEISMAIGERVLFPAVRQADEAGIVVSGISCRQQVLHGTGRPSRHPVQWLADALQS